MISIYRHSAHLPFFKEGDDEEEQSTGVYNSPVNSYSKSKGSQLNSSPYSKNKMLINRQIRAPAGRIRQPNA